MLSKKKSDGALFEQPLIGYYSSSSDLFEFLHSLTADDIYNLQEAVNDWEETLVNTKTVFDLAVVKNFLDRAYAAMKVKRQQLKDHVLHLEHIILCFEDTWKSDQFLNLLNCLESSSLAFSSIKRIHLELIDKEQSKRRRIADILQKSTLSFIRIGRHEKIFDVNVELPVQQTTTNDKRKQQKITFADLSELRDRARLLEYSSNINQRNVSRADSERDIARLRHFIQFTSIIESTIEVLTTLYTTGHPSVEEFLVPRKTFSCTDEKYDDLRQNSIKLTQLVKEWQVKLCTLYETHIDLTYFWGDQFQLIEDYIYNPSSFSHPGYHLLKYIDIDPGLIRAPHTRQQQIPEERLENLGRLLSEQRQPFVPQEGNYPTKNVLLIETTNEGILRAILSLFSLTKTPPIVHRIFYCTPRTNWIQVRAFVYRCFYSQTFHQLIRPELLSQSIQDQFIRLLRSLIEQKPRQTFRIGIITITALTNQQLINGLRSMGILNILRDQQLFNPIDFENTMKQIIQNCTLVTSRITGLGKSSVIRQTIEQSNKVYVKFPIYGDFDVDSLAERLCSKFSQLQTGAIHLDIGSTDNSQQLNEILYCILLFRSFRFGEVAVSIPRETPVYIELDASPQSSLTELRLFEHLHTRIDLKDVNWQILNATSDQIQAVANYLQAIANEKIIKQDINTSTFTKLDVETCSRLIQGSFLHDKNPEYITWTQLSIFIAVFNCLFTGFSRCGYFLRKYVPQPALRMELVQTLLRSSKEFTSLSVEAVRKQQRAVANDEPPPPFSDAIVQWETLQPFTLVFTASDDPLFVYKSSTDIPQALIDYFKNYYQATKQKGITEQTMFPSYADLTHTDFFLKLVSLSRKYFNKAICLKCYQQYEIKEQNCKQCSSKDLLIRPKSFDHADVATFQLFIAERLQNEYVLTADNFIKMLLIYMRVQSGIPVLIMGETGCGKTALIQFLCQKILDDELAIFRVHAGVLAEKIIKTTQGYIQQAKECAVRGKRLWIFFDEFNTTTNIGLLKEIICERTLLGQSLPANMVFLGACNPRRQKTKKILSNDDADIGIRKNRYEIQKLLWTGTDPRLLYTVVAIPETMLEYIWDYGYLNESTETAYIATMLNTCQNLSTDPNLFQLTVRLLVESQKHFRELEDASSVSLRDIARFCRLYNWFLDSLIRRTEENLRTEKSQSFLRRASLIALLLCYYFRLRTVELQKIYINKMQSIMATISPNLIKAPDFLTKYVLESEQKDLIDKRMELPQGTALNRALRDNIFVLFACIVNRIPLFLCGKPGSSKSSAVQIVISNLKGKNSNDIYFQTLPELVAVSFQGSQNSTSESIIKVFERAANYSRVKSSSELLPVIVFDEIGLAELSPHNPLKVLHGELEVENCQYGFVGVSNWRLDASKMNRALYLSTPDPNVEDLQFTGMRICRSMQEQIDGRVIQLEETIIKSLSQAYYDLRDNLHGPQQEYENYFGLRDYYCLIKGIVRELMTTNDEVNIHAIIRRQLKVNFDGIIDGSSLLWQNFCQYMNQQHLFHEYPRPSFNLLLDQALNTRSGRYLMLIADSESAIDYVERYINSHQQKRNTRVRTLVGSSFPGDLLSGNTYAEQYNYRVLMDIILYAETNLTLIMRQMGHLYDNLYDLFNQNFAVSAKKKFCRIALGALYHPRCLVHDDFYCVVFIHKRDLGNCDPPFLNRFEKHLIDLQALVHPRYWSLSRKLHTWLESLLPKNVGKHFPLLQHLFVNYSQDQICNLVIEAFEKLNLRVEGEDDTEIDRAVLNYCQAKLIHTSSFELPLVLSLQPNPQNHALIQQYYEIHQSITFGKLLIEQALQNPTISPHIVYTYTQIFDTIDVLQDGVEEIKLGAFKTELELTNKIKKHYQTITNTRLLLIRVDYHAEHQHILSLKHIVLNERVPTSDRGVWLVFHLQRNLLNQVTNDVLFNEWSANMIDDLNGRALIPKDVLKNPSYRDLVHLEQFRLSKRMFDDLVDRCLSKIRYLVLQKIDESRINERRNRVLQQIIQRLDNSTRTYFHLNSIVEEKLMTLIKDIPPSDNTRFVDWRLDLLTNGVTIASSRSFYDAFQATTSIFHDTYLFLLLVHLEKHNFIDAYFFLSAIQDKNIQKYLSTLWMDCLTSTLKHIDVTTMNLDMIEIQLVFDLNLPCAVAEYENIRRIREKFQQSEDINNEPCHRFDFTFEQLCMSSIYGEEFIQLIFNNQSLFEFYFHDQISMHLKETNIRLSANFVFHLLTSKGSFGKGAT